MTNPHDSGRASPSPSSRGAHIQMPGHRISQRLLAERAAEDPPTLVAVDNNGYFQDGTPIPGDPRSDEVAKVLPAPTRITQAHHPAPLDCLPQQLREFTDTASGFDQTAPEMTVLAGLTSASFATGGSVLIDLNGHHVPLSLWAVLTAEPSERKSAAITTGANSPLGEAVSWFWETHDAEQKRLGRLIRIEEKRIKSLEEALAGTNPTDRAREQLEHAVDTLDTLRAKVVQRPVWSVSDSTTEGLELMMAESGGQAGSFTDEAALLSSIAGRHSRNGSISLASLNSAWSRKAINVKRQHGTRQVDAPHLVMCQFVQPARFADLMGKLREQEDGFLSRWLYANPAPYGPRKPVGAPLDADVRLRWVRVLHNLLNRFWGARDATLLNLTSGAWQVYCQAFDEIDADQRAHTENTALCQWLGKGPADHILRVAALFELIKDQDATQITEESVTGAWVLFRWLRGEAMKAMDAASGDALRPEVEREVMAWVAGRRERDRAAGREPLAFVQSRDLARGPKRFRQMHRDEIEAVLVQLEDQLWFQRTDSAGRTDAQTRWMVRPDFEEKWSG